MLPLHLLVPQTDLAGADRLYSSSLITERIVSHGHICTLSSPTGLFYSDRRYGPDRSSLSQRELCPANTFVLSPVLLVFVTLTNALDQIGPPPAFTGASDKPGRC